MSTFAKEITILGGEYDLTSIPNYTPMATDIITLCPNDIAGNIKVYAEWGSNTWIVKVSDSSYVGKILVIIKT